MLRPLGALVVALTLTPAAAAHGFGIVNQALESLRRGDPVYVHQDAIPTIRTEDANLLRERIAAGGTPIFIAVLPVDAMHEAGSPAAVLRAVRDGLAVDATYGVVVGGVFGAVTASGKLGRDEAAGQAQAALAAHGKEGVAATLLDFVTRVSRDGAESDGASWWPIALAIGAALGLGSVGLLATLARARRRSSAG